MEAFRKIMSHLREMRRLDKDTPARLQAYAQDTLQKSQDTHKGFQEMRDALGTGLAAKVDQLDLRRKQILEADVARLQKILDGIKVDDAAFKEEARKKTIEKWAEILEASNVTGADVRAAHEDRDRTRAGEPNSSEGNGGTTAQSRKPR